jgi:uncharacterized protein (DUF1800 family)
MELYSMGEGNYTENDVRESARAFTGWRLTPPTKVQPPAGLSEKERDEYLDQLWGAYEPAFVLNTKLHDSGTKTFLGQTGNWGGDDIVDIIMKQPATARFITKRLFSEFAYRDPDQGTIDGLVEVWNSSNHNVKAVVRAILTSDEFYSRRAYRALVRSPLEFMVGAVRGLEVETDWLTVEQSAAGMDQRLYEPPSVAGWPGGEVWLSSGTFFGRVNFLDATLFPKNKAVAIPSLSSIEQPVEAIGRKSVELLQSNLKTPSSQEHVLLTPFLVVRGSTKRILKSKP